MLLAPYDELLSMYNDQINIFYVPFKILVRHNITSYLYAKEVEVVPLIIISNGFGHNDFLGEEIVLEGIYNYLQNRLNPTKLQ